MTIYAVSVFWYELMILNLACVSIVHRKTAAHVSMGSKTSALELRNKYQNCNSSTVSCSLDVLDRMPHKLPCTTKKYYIIPFTLSASSVKASQNPLICAWEEPRSFEVQHSTQELSCLTSLFNVFEMCGHQNSIALANSIIVMAYFLDFVCVNACDRVLKV